MKNIKMNVFLPVFLAMLLASCGGGGGGSAEEADDVSEGTGPVRCTIQYHEAWQTITAKNGSNWTWADESSLDSDVNPPGGVDISGCTWKNVFTFMEGFRSGAYPSNKIKSMLFHDSLKYVCGGGLMGGEFPSDGPLSFANIKGYDAYDGDWQTAVTPAANDWNSQAEATICDTSYRELADLLHGWSDSAVRTGVNFGDQPGDKLKTLRYRPEEKVMNFPLYGWKNLSSKHLETKMFNFPFKNSYDLTDECNLSFSWDIKEETRHKWSRRIETITLEALDYISIVSCPKDGVYGSLSIQDGGRKAVFTYTYDDNLADTGEIKAVDDPEQQLQFLLSDGTYFTVNLAGSIPEEYR